MPAGAYLGAAAIAFARQKDVGKRTFGNVMNLVFVSPVPDIFASALLEDHFFRRRTQGDDQVQFQMLGLGEEFDYLRRKSPYAASAEALIGAPSSMFWVAMPRSNWASWRVPLSQSLLR